MARRVLRITHEATVGFAGETKQQFDIIQYANGTYCSKYTHGFETTKTPLSDSEVKNIFALLSNVTIAAFPEHHMGDDGDFTEIEVGDYAGKSHYRWWSVPPKGWEELNKVTDKIISLL